LVKCKCDVDKIPDLQGDLMIVTRVTQGSGGWAESPRDG